MTRAGRRSDSHRSRPRARELVDASVAVVIANIGAHLDRGGTNLADAGSPHGARGSGVRGGAGAHPTVADAHPRGALRAAVAALGGTNGALTSLIGDAVAVVIEPVAGLGRRQPGGHRADRHAVRVENEEAGSRAGANPVGAGRDVHRSGDVDGASVGDDDHGIGRGHVGHRGAIRDGGVNDRRGARVRHRSAGATRVADARPVGTDALQDVLDASAAAGARDDAALRLTGGVDERDPRVRPRTREVVGRTGDEERNENRNP